MKDGSDPKCRECGTVVETVGYILSAFESHLYKDRHDGILNMLVKAQTQA